MKRLLVALLFALPGATGAADGLASAAPLFALTLNSADGQSVALGSLKGKPLLVNFWARWCLPCRREIPDLAAVHARYRGRGLVVVGIAVEDDANRDSVREFATAYELNYTSLIGGMPASIDLMQTLGNGKSGLPFTVVIDRGGRIRSSKLGAMSQAEMVAAIQSVL